MALGSNWENFSLIRTNKGVCAEFENGKLSKNRKGISPYLCGVGCASLISFYAIAPSLQHHFEISSENFKLNSLRIRKFGIPKKR